MNAGKVKYADAEKAIPDLKGKRLMIVIIGYKSCPGSSAALGALQRHPTWGKNGNAAFVGFDRGPPIDQLREQVGYPSGSGNTMPIVFLRNTDGEMEHVGGGTDFADIVHEQTNPTFL